MLCVLAHLGTHEEEPSELLLMSQCNISTVLSSVLVQSILELNYMLNNFTSA